jgi:Tol biopolymer transport system component
MMDPPVWLRVKEVVAAALDRPPGERDAGLRELCGGDGLLRAEAESLLAAIGRAGTFLERPPRMLEAGESLGPYEVLDFLGAGGMGEVYRARDARLNREVALKIPSESLVADSVRRARFMHEAQVLASLNHPNIGAIYGFEDAGHTQAIVLEFVAGTSLASLIADGPLPIERVLVMANQIAAALQAAHDLGVVHRDLKPANIMVRADGTIKILDFGIAKTLHPSNVAIDGLPPSADVGRAVTHTGVFAGTAAYVSPEQALARPVNHRTDIWTFGCVLYEMLTGRQAFRGETIDDTLRSVLSATPDWSALPANAPDAVVTMLHRCLEKDPACRLPDMAAARHAIDSAERASARAAFVRRRAAAWAFAVAVTAIGAGAWMQFGVSPPHGATGVRRLLIGLPDSRPLARAPSMPLGVGQASIAIAPDGTRVAYVMERDGVTQLYLRALEAQEAEALPNTQGAFGPFFSPDGQWIAFFARNRLKKVAVSGGDPIDLCAAPNPYGGSWGTDGTILFAPDEGRRPSTIPDTGGTVARVAIVDDRGSWTWPDLLPGGKTAIVSHAGGIGLLSIASGEYRTLIDNGSDGRYAASGHLIFARAGRLLAAPFDLERFAVTGPPAVVLEGVRMEGQRAVAQAAFSRDGTLIYVPGGAANTATTPVWRDRHGRVEPVGLPARAYRSFSLSPDGTRLAIAFGDSTTEVWVHDLVRGATSRLTTGGNHVQLLWTPDGTRVVFTERTGGAATPFWVPVNGVHAPERMFARDHQGGVFSFSPSGNLVAFQRRGPGTGLDLFVRPLDPAESAQSYLRTTFTEVGPRFSPDGRWIAYVSDESGRYEVYARPYPPRPGKWQVSIDGGEEGIWSRDGRELFYRNGSKWMVAAVTLHPEFTVGVPRLLFEGPYVNVGGGSYDVTPDARRFLLLAPPADAAPVTHLNVVLNWFEHVKRNAGSR